MPLPPPSIGGRRLPSIPAWHSGNAPMQGGVLGRGMRCMEGAGVSSDGRNTAPKPCSVGRGRGQEGVFVVCDLGSWRRVVLSHAIWSWLGHAD